MQQVGLAARQSFKRIGFVPTMGALHEGHYSLIRKCRDMSDLTVVSVFVNPTQFGPNEDYAKYPRTFDSDCSAVESLGGDIVFAPQASEMYPQGFRTNVEVSGLTQNLCGASRPGHFRGVTTVVMKFFNIVMPHIAVFGQKDAQQAIVLKRMVDDLNVPTKMVVAPTIRETDGLAMSSRNKYLSEGERSQAPVLFRGLCRAKERFEQGEKDAKVLKQIVLDHLGTASLLRPEYVEIVGVGSLQPIEHLHTPSLCAIACRTVESSTRLIDNILLGGSL